MTLAAQLPDSSLFPSTGADCYHYVSKLRATMKRREFITLLGGTSVIRPIAAWAQQRDHIARIGVLVGLAEGDSQTKARLAAFREGLERRGWSEGRNVRIDYRFAPSGPDRYQPLAKELIILQPDVILAHSTPV